MYEMASRQYKVTSAILKTNLDIYIRVETPIYCKKDIFALRYGTFCRHIQ